MNARLLVFTIFVGMLGIAELFALPIKQTSANSIELVPPSIGEFQRNQSGWNIQRMNGSSEEGAVYSRSGSKERAELPIQLDFFRNVTSTHDGVLCYLLQGELLHRSEHVSLQTTTKPVRLLLSLTGTKERLRLVATTECFANYCDEENLQAGWGIRLPEFASIKAAFLNGTQISSGVVPVSIMITAEANEHNRADIEHVLRSQMHDFLQAFDFSPAQLQAASQ